MDPVIALRLIDASITALTATVNLVGASRPVSDAIARRIAEGREWTDEERATVQAQLEADKAYAAQQIAKAP